MLAWLIIAGGAVVNSVLYELHVNVLVLTGIATACGYWARCCKRGE